MLLIYSVAAILHLQFMVYVMLFPTLNTLYFYISTFRRTCAVPHIAVLCSSSISCFPPMLLRYFLNYFEIASVVPVVTGTTFIFTSRMRCISTVRSSYF